MPKWYLNLFISVGPISQLVNANDIIDMVWDTKVKALDTTESIVAIALAWQNLGKKLAEMAKYMSGNVRQKWPKIRAF